MARQDKIQHKRSNQLINGNAKAPPCQVLDYGELAVNFSEEDPALFLKNDNNIVVRLTGNQEIPPGTHVGETPPSSPSVGDLWWDVDDGVLYIYYRDQNSEQWVPATPTIPGPKGNYGEKGNRGNPGVKGDPGDGSNVEVPTLDQVTSKGNTTTNDIITSGTVKGGFFSGDGSQLTGLPESGSSTDIGDVPPTDPNIGDMWWNNEDGKLYIYYKDDNDDEQWVSASPDVGVKGPKGESGTSIKGEQGQKGAIGETAGVVIQETAPLDADSFDGDMWWNNEDGKLYVYYTDDNNDSQWVAASPDVGVKGAVGPKGDDGDPGEKGEPGALPEDWSSIPEVP